MIVSKTLSACSSFFIFSFCIYLQVLSCNWSVRAYVHYSRWAVQNWVHCIRLRRIGNVWSGQGENIVRLAQPSFISNADVCCIAVNSVLCNTCLSKIKHTYINKRSNINTLIILVQMRQTSSVSLNMSLDSTSNESSTAKEFNAHKKAETAVTC